MSLKDLTRKATLVFDIEARQVLTNWIFYPSILPKAMRLSALLVPDDGNHNEIDLARALLGLQKDPHLIDGTKFRYIVDLLAICVQAILSKKFQEARDALNRLLPCDDRAASTFTKECQGLVKDAKVFIDVAELREALAKEKRTSAHKAVNWATAKSTLFTGRAQADFIPTFTSRVHGLRR